MLNLKHTHTLAKPLNKWWKTICLSLNVTAPLISQVSVEFKVALHFPIAEVFTGAEQIKFHKTDFCEI